ncbi:glycosyltransferase WbuB [uncultured Paraglaciecola sp.]|uniref:glycosyltransferase WbuB n=1 Tax=uncultured Paraglaciecola sp. TaxID=1765024 RepID=UPI0030D789DC|tara:strand:- start:3115 stop:4353 length:1239 start_codon:yes stop_codon:yes gene_type:complete
MKFILNSLNYSPELTGIGKYNGEMCPELVKRGIEVKAMVAPPYYPEWQVHDGFINGWYSKSFEQGVIVHRCPLYVPKQATTVKRIIHLSSFAFTSGLALLGQLFKKPDVIFLVQPTLFCAPIVLLIGKLTGAKTIMHIQDFEIDAMLGLGMAGTEQGKVGKFAKTIERWLLSKFDAVSSISYSMLDNAKRKGVADDKLLLFPNWSDTDFVTPNTSGDKLKQEWGFSPTDQIVLYAGNIGKKQGLEVVLEAAQHYLDQPSIKFVFVGAGAHVDELKNMANNLHLTNVHFLPLQPWERVPEMLALANIHLVVQKKGAADAVLPSKLTNILSAGGHALVTAESDTELGKLAKTFDGIYQCVEPENLQAFLGGLAKMFELDLSHHNTVARQYAEEYLAKDKILDKFVEDLQQLVSQ